MRAVKFTSRAAGCSAYCVEVILISPILMRFDEIWAAAGHPQGVFKLHPADLVHLTGAPVVDVASGDVT